MAKFSNKGTTKDILSLIKEERKKINRPGEKSWWEAWFYKVHIYIPSKVSFAVIFISFSVVAFVLFKLLDGGLPYFQTLSLDNLIAAHAGIGTIIFALVIFVAESSRDDEERDKARVLLKESYLFPLVVVEILAFFSFLLIRDGMEMGVVLVIAIGFFTIYSSIKIISVLLNKHRFAQKRVELLQERLSMMINLVIDEIIGNKILFSKLGGKEVKLISHHFRLNDKSHYECFMSDRIGVVSNIHLDKLKEAAELIDEEADKNNYSFSGDNMPNFSISLGNSIQRGESGALQENNERYLMKGFHDTVDVEHLDLICIDKKILRGSKKRGQIDALIKKAFVIKKSVNNFVEEAYSELSGASDQLLSAIQDRHLAKIRELVNLYVQLVDTFLDQIGKNLDSYFAEHVREGIYSPFSRQTPISWLLDNISNFLERAWKSRDKEVLKRVAYLQKVVVEQATVKRDYYLLQRILEYAESLYLFSLKEQDQDLRELLVYLSLRLLKRLPYEHVKAELEKENEGEDGLRGLKLSSGQFLIVFQRLIKRSFDKRDYENFKRFIQEARDFSIGFRMAGESNFQSRLEEIEKEINTKRYQMSFGLTSWILDQVFHSEEKDRIKRFYYDMSPFFSSLKIERFTDIFLSTYSISEERFWERSWWDVADDGGVRLSDSFEKLRRFYVVYSLSLLADQSEEEIKKIELSFPAQDSVYLLDDLSELLDDIKKNPYKWEFVLPENAINKVDLFNELLLKTKEIKEEEMRKRGEEMKIRKREKEISQERVRAFKEEVKSSFNDATNLNRVFEYLGIYEDKVGERNAEKKERFGINTIRDKAVFFDEWHESYSHWGEHCGHALASGEDALFFNALAKNCGEIAKEDFAATLSKFDSPHDIVIFTTNAYRDFRNFLSDEDRKNFTPEWHKKADEIEKKVVRPEVKGFGGWYRFKGQQILVFEAHCGEIDNQILILDKSKMGKFVQLYPVCEGEKEEFVEDILYMDIRAFSESEELVKELFKANPEWLEKKGDREKQREYLYEHVRIKILACFEYDKPHNFKGYKIIREKD